MLNNIILKIKPFYLVYLVVFIFQNFNPSTKNKFQQDDFSFSRPILTAAILEHLKKELAPLAFHSLTIYDYKENILEFSRKLGGEYMTAFTNTLQRPDFTIQDFEESIPYPEPFSEKEEKKIKTCHTKL